MKEIICLVKYCIHNQDNHCLHTYRFARLDERGICENLKLDTSSDEIAKESERIRDEINKRE